MKPVFSRFPLFTVCLLGSTLLTGYAPSQAPPRRLLALVKQPVTSHPTQTDIPIDPINGGMSIPTSALQDGDIIFSTTASTSSTLIRFLTGSGPVSHARVFVREAAIPMAFEAIPMTITKPGRVTKSLLEPELQRDQAAAAFRVRGITPAQRQKLLAFLNGEIGKPYAYVTALASTNYPFKSYFYRNTHVSVDIKNSNPKGYICSQLVETAFRQAGMPVFTVAAYPPSPNNLVTVSLLQDKLEYIGHLRTP